MFHLGLTGGFKPGLQRSDLWLPISFPKKPRGTFPRQSSLSAASAPPAAACGRSGGTRRKGARACHRGLFFLEPSQSQGPESLSSCHLDF